METVLITGASSGIGWELARLFAPDVGRLILVARNQNKLEDLAKELSDKYPPEITVLSRDLSEPSSPERIFNELKERGISVDVLVNNAGFGFVGSVDKLSLEQQMDMIQVNIAALTALTRLFLPGIIERGRGGILNVGSVAGFQPGPNMAVYFATKAYVLSFTEALAEELMGTGVKVTCLAPGATETGFGAASGMEKLAVFRMGAMDVRVVSELGYRGFRQGRVLVIPGLRNRVGATSVRFVPRSLVRKLVKRLNS